MDLSKAFDCLPHGLIIDKLAAYGLSDSACSLLQSYLSDRKQMVKLGHCKSTFLKIIKGDLYYFLTYTQLQKKPISYFLGQLWKNN